VISRDDPSDGSPHLLYVAWGFPPARSGGVYRALATANAFARSGWRVTVLTADRETFERHTGTDPGLEDQVDSRIRVVRVPFAWPLQEQDRSRWPVLRRRFPRVWRRARIAADRIPFPETVYGPWRTPLARAAIGIHEEHPVDLVVASANPNVDFTAAHALHRHSAVPYVLDYRDAWLLDVFDGHQIHTDRSRAARWEKRLVGSAAEVWFVNAPIRDWHATRYPEAADRMHVVANGFDPEFAPDGSRGGRRRGGPLRFGYIGTVSAKVPVAEFLEGWRAARRRCPELADATATVYGHLGFYAEQSPRLRELLTGYSDDGVSYGGPVSKTAVAATYADLDALLLILGTGRYVTSGKVYEYMASGLPIVSVHHPDNAASTVLDGYPAWFAVADLSTDEIAARLCDAARVATEASPDRRSRCVEFAAQYVRDRQLMPRVEALRAVVTTRR
jgi:glycosyltransferase involved in cell wall biosynthesis